MNQPRVTLVKLLACCVATLATLPVFSGQTDASYGSSATLVEPGVDLSAYIVAGTPPPLALDGFGSAWTVADKGRAHPALLRIDGGGRIDPNLIALDDLPALDSAMLATGPSGDIVLCGKAQAEFTLHVRRFRVDAPARVAILSASTASVPPPLTTVDIVTGTVRNVGLSPVNCIVESDGSVLLYYSKRGSIASTLVLHRFNANGTVDAAFGNAGTVVFDGSFNLGATIQLAPVSLVWVGTDRVINVLAENAVLQLTAGSPYVHPVMLTRLSPPTGASTTWQATQRDLTFEVPGLSVLPIARFAIGDDIVFFGQTFVVGAASRVALRRIDAKTGISRFVVDDVAVPVFGPAIPGLTLNLIHGVYLVMAGNGIYAGNSPAGLASARGNSLWIKRFNSSTQLQSVAGGIAVDAINGFVVPTPLPQGGMLLAASAIARRDGGPASPGVLRFAPDYLLPRSVEFHDPAKDTYFFSSNSDEIEQVSAWMRSGVLPWQGVLNSLDAQSFRTWPKDVPNAQTARACRFFIPSLGTHFVSAVAAECAKYSQAAYAPVFVTEDPQFAVTLPSLTGACPVGKASVRRFLRPPPQSPSHRWVATESASTAMRGRGWIDEGIVFCEPLY